MKGHKGIRAGWAAGNQHLYMVNHVRAKEMRQNPTEAEKVVWEIVRANRLGYKFRRQQTIGEYIVDFFCLLPHPKPLSSSEGMCKGLVIEVDGGYHDTPEQKEADRKKQEWLEKNGYRVLRFRNEEMIEVVDMVRERIVRALEEREVRAEEIEKVKEMEFRVGEYVGKD